MNSVIAEVLHLKFHPVAIKRTDTLPEHALQFKEHRSACAMFLFANAALGKTCVVSATTCGCPGAVSAFGFGDGYADFPGGLDGFAGFLSRGNEGSTTGKKISAGLEASGAKDFAYHYLHGECFKKNPELVLQWHHSMPRLQNNRRYVVLKPLEMVDETEESPEVIVFTADADQLSSLVTLANYGHAGREMVSIPWASGCQLIGLLPLKEAESALPHAVVGLTDLSARKSVRSQLGSECLSFAMPWSLFQEMEENLPGSFVERPTFQSLQKSSR